MNSVKLQDTKLIHRNLLHFYTIQRLEREIKETIPFTFTSKRIKYIGINLPKEAKDPKDLYSKNCKTLMEEITGDTNRPRITKAILKKKKTGLAESGSLTSWYIRKQLSKQYGTGTTTEINISGIG